VQVHSAELAGLYRWSHVDKVQMGFSLFQPALIAISLEDGGTECGVAEWLLVAPKVR